jgi:hypothetical protein
MSPTIVVATDWDAARAQSLDDAEHDALMAKRGLILWARVHSSEQEDRAQDILRVHGGRAVRVHEIELEKRSDDLSLGTVRPDPWLGSEPLGHP